jgi:RNA polymerase sigma-70 factor (ECF subfamily)
MTDQADLIYERLLVVRAQAGDDAAFAELVERFSPRLRYFLRKLLASPCRERPPWRSDDVEDTLQDVWLDVLRALPRLNDPQALVAWLYRIARDRAFARLRKARPTEQLRDDNTIAEATADDGRDFSAEDATQIHAALDTLPPEQREVLVLRFLEDMTYEQIASVTNSNLGTVRSRLHYAKRALRIALTTSSQNSDSRTPSPESRAPKLP